MQISLHQFTKIKNKVIAERRCEENKNRVKHSGTIDTVYKGLMLVMLNLHDSVDSDQALSNRHA